MKAYSIKPHYQPKEEIIIFGDDSLNCDKAVSKASRLSTRFKKGIAHTIQRIDTMPDDRFSASFGSGHKTFNFSGLSIEQAIKKAENDSFVSGSVTHFERPLSYLYS